MVILPAPESPVNHNVNPRSNLPLSIIKFSLLDEFALLAVYFGPHALDEDLDNLGAAELRRRVLALGEHLAHPGPGEEDVLLLVVRAGLGGRHPLAAQAEKGVLKHERRYPQLLGLKLLKRSEEHTSELQSRQYLV